MGTKRKLEESSDYHSDLPLPLPLPLTRENLSKLHNLTDTMPPTPSISSKEGHDIAPSECRLMLSLPQPPMTPSSARSTASGETTSISRAREILARNNMVIDNDRHLSDDILNYFQSIVKDTRHSTMKAASAKLFVKMRKDLAMRNEDTFLGNIRPLIFKPTRKVESSSSVENVLIDKVTNTEQDGAHEGIAKGDFEKWVSNPASDAVFMDRAYLDDHLDCNINKEFARGFIPLRLDDELALADLFTSRSKPANAKPDLAFGTSHQAWTDEERTTSGYVDGIAHISEGINYPFLILEGKSASGTLEDAQNQACRAGAALVNAYTQLQVMTGTQHAKDGANLRSIVFSISMTPTLAYVNAHWSYRINSTVLYYMTKISGHQLDETDDVITLRRNINNILDWGLLKRRLEIQDDLAKLRERLVQGKISPNASPKKRQRVGW